MNKDERDLLIACCEAIEELHNAFWYIDIPKNCHVNIEKLNAAMSEIDYGLRKLKENEEEN